MTGGKVIVLGGSGKNFAAGMSGGIAYVLDEKGIFEGNCNTEMVDLESVDETEEKIWLRETIERHQQYTGSQRADNLLKNWEEVLAKFVKVMPIEYKAVLEKLQKISLDYN
jgi:glutamate synthase domain-containing protein 3